jgi:two-component sensor histidine kinase
VKLGRSNEGCRLAVRNRGVLPPGYDPGAARGFGMQMVSNLVVQLRGRLQSSTMAGETEFAVTFPLKTPQPTILGVVEGGQSGPEAAPESRSPPAKPA